MKKRILALALAALMLCSLAACSSSKTSTTTTSTTVNGQTTTTTTTTVTENGQTTSTTTVTESSAEEAPADLRERWAELFAEGAEGRNADGENYLFAYSEDFTFGAFMILNDDMDEQLAYVFGDIEMDDSNGVVYTIQDVDGELSLRFSIMSEDDDSIELRFKDGDVVTMEKVDRDVIIDDMVGLIDAGIAY